MGSAPRYEWPEESIEFVCACKKRNFSNERIARRLSEKLHLVISEAMVADCWNRLIDLGYFEDKPEFERVVAKSTKNRNRHFEGKHVRCPKRATLLHLLDLKRAGHSPAKTELKIESDFWPKRLPESNNLRSYTGSHAAMCAMEA
jgi:hypothetical protein